MLVGNKIAIASVGVSCQTAEQIEHHAARIKRLAGDETLEDHGGPFDWVLAGARSCAEMIDAGAYFPQNFGELGGHGGEFAGKKGFWPRFSLHFWHESTLDFADFTSKRRHLANNFDAIRGSARRIFVVSNTQNNISRALADREPIETRLLWDDVVALSDALLHKFGAAELHVVTRSGLDSPIRPNRPPLGDRPAIVIHKIGKDGSQWAGNANAWADLFEKIIP